MGERELAEDTGLARSAYMSSESALRTELLVPDVAEETDDTLLTLRDLGGAGGKDAHTKAFITPLLMELLKRCTVVFSFILLRNKSKLSFAPRADMGPGQAEGSCSRGEGRTLVVMLTFNSLC